MSDEENALPSDSAKEESEVSFLPSAFEQAREYMDESAALSNTADSTTSKPEKVEPVEFELVDVEDAVNLPFDLARIITKHKGFTLTPDEQARLGRRWLKPFQQYFGTVKGMALYLALSATITIGVDKTLDYLEKREQEKERQPQGK